jgi:hypothetical protein
MNGGIAESDLLWGLLNSIRFIPTILMCSKIIPKP